MTTTSRLLHLLSLLQTRRDWPGGVLAGRLEVSHRTVRRDVDRLREMGYRISAVKGPDGGYRLDAGSELPPLLFDDDQAVALAVALQTAAASGAGIEEAALRALTTVRQVLPSRLRHRIDALEFTAIPAGRTAPVVPDVLLALSGAVRAQEVLRFDYPAGQPEAPDNPAPVRRVEPHHLVTVRGRWYLVGWDLEREDWRIFRADRMLPRAPSGPRFIPRELPGGDVHHFVTARFKGSDQAIAWPCTGSVLLNLPAVEVLPFAGDGTVEDLGPCQCRLTSGSWSWVSLAASFGRFDADLEAVSPPQLTAAFETLASRFAAAAASPVR